MPDGPREAAWLLALEATLSFSAPVWTSSTWGRPATHPIAFILVLMAVAAASTVLFHVAPACFAARCAPLESRVSWALVPVGVGYALYSLRLFLDIQWSWPFPKALPSQITLAVCLLLIAALALVRSWWKLAAVVALLVGAGLSAYMLTTPWHGIWAVNFAFAKEPLPESRYLAEGLFLALAPAFVIAWRIGRLERRTTRIWVTAALGISLPLVLSASIAALMAQAGENLFWRPSLFLDFWWALGGPSGGHTPTTGRAISTLAVLSLVGPTIVAALSVRFLAPTFSMVKKVTVAVAAVLVIVWLIVTQPYPQPYLSFGVPHDPVVSLWTLLVAVLGMAAGLASLFPRASGLHISREQ